MENKTKYDWDKLFKDWEAVRTKKTIYVWDEVVLTDGKDKISYSSHHYLSAEGKYSYLENLPIYARQSLADYMRQRVSTKEELEALDQLRKAGVIK